MAVRITLTGILDDFWGADGVLEDSGVGGLRELLDEDLSAMMENLTLRAEFVEDEPAVTNGE